MGKVATEATLAEGVEYLKMIAGNYDWSDYRHILSAIRSGNGNLVPNGITFTVPSTKYGDVQWITRRKNVDKLYDDETKPTITIQTKYLLSTNGGSSALNVQFDRAEAFAVADEDLAAGTVCSFTATACSSWTAGVYYFTLNKAVTKGMLFAIQSNCSTALASNKVIVYENAQALTAYDTCSIATSGTATKDLGAWETDLNHPHRISYGSNNNAESAIRQLLNGSGLMSDIWEPQTKYDLMPTAFTSLYGFLGTFPEDFQNALGYAKVHNIANTVFESQDSKYTKGTEYYLRDKIWLPSTKEIYNYSRSSLQDNTEEQIPYYADTVGSHTAQADADYVKYALMYAEKASSPSTNWLRTCHTSYAYYVDITYAGYGGALGSLHAHYSYAVAPLAILA